MKNVYIYMTVHYKKKISILLMALLMLQTMVPYAHAVEELSASLSADLSKTLPVLDQTATDSATTENALKMPSVTPQFTKENTVQSAQFRGNTYLEQLGKKTFQTKEKINIKLKNARGRHFKITLLDSSSQETSVKVDQQTVDDDESVTFAASSQLKPGKYTIKLTDDRGVTSEESFTWGVLAINTDRSIYLPGQKASIAMAVLDEKGEMVCNANVTLKITDPQGKETTLSTMANTILVGQDCRKKILTLTPDYQTEYQMGGVGTYRLFLSAVTKNGEEHITDSLEVKESLPFVVTRLSATRLYPPLTYPMVFEMTPTEDFTGTVSEIVPESFTVSDPKIASISMNKIIDLKDVKSFSREAIVPAGSTQKDVLGAQTFSIGMPFSSDDASASALTVLKKHPVNLGFGEQIDDPEEKIKYSQFGLLGHDGIDFAASVGTPITTVDIGTVVLAEENSDYGKTVVIQHGWGKSYYGHLSKITVKKGDNLSKGDTLGLSGNSGITTGPHLHFGIKLNEYNVKNGYFGKIDPAPYLGLPSSTAVLGASTSKVSNVRVLTWNITAKKGQTVKFGYLFKAPPVSPQFYTLGPLKIFNEKNSQVFQESRSWQLASDAYSGTQVKTVEYILGGGTDGTNETTATMVYAGSSWNTTKASAGTTTIYLAGTNIDIKNAYVEARTIRSTAANITDVDMTFDANPGPNAGSDTRVSPVIQSGANYQGSTGLSQWLLVRADVTSQFETQSDSDWSTGVTAVAGLSVTGPSFAASTMKLVITYELDYSTSSHTELKTVRFPIDSTVSGDTGSTQAACAASTTCSFSYNAQIPDLLSSSNSNIKSVFFELHGNSDSATAPSLTPQINGGTAGTSVSEQEVIADERDMYILYKPIVGGSDFVPNAAGQLDIVNGGVALNTLGGELVVTYLYSTGASTQTDTVRYWIQQQTAETGTTKTAFPDGASNITISNSGLSVKNLWYRVHTAHAGAQTFTVYGTVGSNTEKSQAYTLTGTNARAGETTLVYDMSADASSFSSSTIKVAGASKFSSATADTEVGVELFVTFTWSGSGGGTQTKTILSNAGTSPIDSVVATEYHNFSVNISLPESVTKTHRSTYIDTTQMHSQSATTIGLGTVTTYLNGGSILALSEQDDTEAFSRTYVASVSAELFTGDTTASYKTIAYQRRTFTVSATISNANIFDVSNVYVVTYDAAFSETGTAETSKSLRTVEYVLGGGSDTTARATTVVTYAGSSWNTTKGSAGTVSVAIPGTGIQVRNAYLEARVQSTAAVNTTDIDMTLDATPGPNAGTDGRFSPVIQGTYWQQSGLDYWFMTRANVTSQLSIQSDSQWNSGVAVVASMAITGPTTQLNSMKLIITYEQDYSEASHTELKTVRFPLTSTTSGDTGTKRAACAASTTCSFTYNAQIPDLLSSDNANISSAFFELHANTDTNTVASFSAQINGGTPGSPLSEGDTVNSMRDLYALYKPIVGGSDFLPNTSQQLDIVNGTTALSVLGGELVVTYKYSTGAAAQTETVRFFSQQQTAETGVTKTAFTTSSYTISNTGLSVKNLWYKVTTAPSAAQTFTVYGKVGSATEQSQAYTVPGTKARGGEVVVIYNMSADAASFNAATTTVTGNTQFSSATGDTEVGAEMYVTFTWTGTSLGTQTRTVLYNSGTSGTGSSVANEYHNFVSNIFLPETVTKTYRSAYVLNTSSHSNATSTSLGTFTLTLNGVTSLAISEQDDTEAFSRTYLQTISSTDFSGGSTISFKRRSFELTDSLSVANRAMFSNAMVVTYDAAYAAGGSTPVTLNLQVSANDNDGMDVAGDSTFHSTGDPDEGTPFSNTSHLTAGGKNVSGSVITAGFRFTGVTIPQGATITSATFDVQEQYAGNYSTNVKTLIYGSKQSDVAAVFSNSNLPRNITKTTASATWNSSGTVGADGTWYSTTASAPPSLTSIIQEIVDQGSWSSGNSLALIVTDNGSTNDWWWQPHSYEGGAAKAAKLDITYTSSASTPTLDQLMRHGKWFSSGVKQPFTF